MDILESFLSKVPSLLRPMVNEFLNEAGIVVGVIAKKYEVNKGIDTATPEHWTVEVYEIATGKRAYYAVAQLQCDPLKGDTPRTRIISRLIETRDDTLEWFSAQCTAEILKVVDL